MVCAVLTSQVIVHKSQKSKSHMTNNEVPQKRDTLKEVMEGLRCYAGSRVFVCKFFLSFCSVSYGGCSIDTLNFDF